MKYIKLFRIKHYIKNLLILIPLFFSHSINDFGKLNRGLLGILLFCLASSSVYIINDVRDREKDKLHPKKSLRPIASGGVSVSTAMMLCVSFAFAAISVSCRIFGLYAMLYLVAYLLINIIYSICFKDYPIIDICLLSSGYLIRMLYGGKITDTAISNWLHFAVIFASLYFVLGKRRNELSVIGKKARKVLNGYKYKFLDKFMYVSMTLFIMFYALWSMESKDKGMIWTTPLLFVILMRYSYIVEGESDADPVEVLFSDKVLLVLVAFFMVIIFCILYVL